MYSGDYATTVQHHARARARAGGRAIGRLGDWAFRALRALLGAY